MEATILIVDDVPANQNLLRQALEPHGVEILLASTGEIAVQVAQRAAPDLILLDVMMPGLDGYETCRRLKRSEVTRDIPVIFITAERQTPRLVEAFRAGGVDYVTKPFQTEEIIARIETHLKVSRLTRKLQQKNAELEAAIQQRQEAEEALATADGRLSLLSSREAEQWGLPGFVGQSKTFERILQDIRKVQQAGTITVLITGESGTGKELIARAIHFGGPRAKGPFVAVNCSAVPHDLAESLLFGHVKGSFSGAHTDQKGYFELANGGTLFLDEIGDMPQPVQAKLLRVLEGGSIMPLGATREKRVDVRVIAASNVDFDKHIAEGKFRQDLFFRLARFPVAAPPLRDRPDDIPLLIAHFLKIFATEMGMKAPTLDADALAALMNHSFPGNIRELKNIVERALIESNGGRIRADHLKLSPTSTPQATHAQKPDEIDARCGLPLNLEQAELLLIHRALSQTQGNVSKAAGLLGINRARIYRALAQAEDNNKPG